MSFLSPSGANELNWFLTRIMQKGTDGLFWEWTAVMIYQLLLILFFAVFLIASILFTILLVFLSSEISALLSWWRFHSWVIISRRCQRIKICCVDFSKDMYSAAWNFFVLLSETCEKEQIVCLRMNCSDNSILNWLLILSLQSVW